ncbi:MAG: Rieske 2Fe-2S domain-containing protein [Planctomycetes bacterium]|nr:Rieske 2Fe-2S domain-containing protein [Planctomycetota bacterium]
MATLVRVARVADVPPGTGRVVKAGDLALALFNVGGDFRALGNVCPHRGGSLGLGALDGATVSCPLHAWPFDVGTGICPDNPAVRVPSYPTKVEGEDVWVQV